MTLICGIVFLSYENIGVRLCADHAVAVKPLGTR
jgi:hypothetical protein